ARQLLLLSVAPRPPPRSPLFPYTTLFRSRPARRPGPDPAIAAARPRRTPTASRPIAASHGVKVQPGGDGTGRDGAKAPPGRGARSEEHTSELQSRENLVCRLLLEKKKERE